MKTIKIKRLVPTALLPERANPTDALDLFQTNDTDVVIKAGERALIHTGIAIELEPGYEAQIRSKSGLALKKGLMVLNSPGTIDYAYDKEIGVILFNTSKEDVVIEKGTKVAQMVINKVELPEVVEVDEIYELMYPTARRDGFGSTGLKPKE